MVVLGLKGYNYMFRDLKQKKICKTNKPILFLFSKSTTWKKKNRSLATQSTQPWSHAHWKLKKKVEQKERMIAICFN